MDTTENNVLVVGTGTIGEPLIGLLSRMKIDLDINEVIFHKRSPLKHEVPKVESLIKNGAKLAVDSDVVSAFRDLGHDVSYTYQDALTRSKVVIDCTPAGNINKKAVYEKYPQKTYIAQGSEKGFGIPYALGINDEKLVSLQPKSIQVVSCNTHAIARLLSCITNEMVPKLIHGDFTCIRRANDVSQTTGFVPSVVCSKHDDEIFGTHHARDVNDLLDFSFRLPIFSSAIKTNTQYMHAVRFCITVDENLSKEEVLDRIKTDKFVSLTSKKSSNTIFSFGRDHGFYGRIYTQAVISEPSLYVKNFTDATRIAGVVFTPQDGNSLMSSVASCLFGLHGEDYLSYLHILDEMLVNEV